MRSLRASTFAVYLLVSECGTTYIGQTRNLRRRFREHCSGKSRSTRGRTWHLVAVRHVLDRGSAVRLERQLKRRRHWRHAKKANWEFVRWIRSARGRVERLTERFGFDYRVP